MFEGFKADLSRAEGTTLCGSRSCGLAIGEWLLGIGRCRPGQRGCMRRGRQKEGRAPSTMRLLRLPAGALTIGEPRAVWQLIDRCALACTAQAAL